MAVEIITQEDLQEFKQEMLKEISRMFTENNLTAGKKWLRSAEVKKLLKISSGTLQNYRRNGTLPHTRIGGTLYYDYAMIKRLLRP